MRFLKNKINLIISLLIIVMVVLILFSSYRCSKSYVEGATGSVMNPIQRAIYNVSKSIHDTYIGITQYSELVDKVEELSKENGELRTKIKLYSQLDSENRRLRDILNLKNELKDYNFIGANIIGKNGPYTGGYIIDLGDKDGIKKGMTVVSNGGLFGMVVSVSKDWSIVSPIINGDISISGFVQRTNGNQGIISKHSISDGNYILKMEYLPVDEDVAVGDVVVTSGLGGVYPSNIVIGDVISIENDKRSLTKSVLIKSHVNFDFANELFVILPQNIDKVEY